MSHQHDEESDREYAMRLSEELNGGHQLPLSSASKAPAPDDDDDADFAYALELQFGDSHRPRDDDAEASAAQLRGGALTPWNMKEDGQKVATYHTETPGGKIFTALTDLDKHVQSVRCSTCGHGFFKSGLDISTMIQNWKSGTAALTSELVCLECWSKSCIACKPQPYVHRSVVGAKGKQVTWCCAGGRLFVLWLLLCSVDEHYFMSKAKDAANMEEKKKKAQSAEKKKKEDKSLQRPRSVGVGFGGPSRRPKATQIFHQPSGMGFASDMMDYYRALDYDDDGSLAAEAFSGPGHTLSGGRFNRTVGGPSVKSMAMSAQNSEDDFYELHLELLEGLLPSFERGSTFDLDPPDAVADMLVHSRILHYCSELLRNDSLEDATKRKGVYQALISFLRTMGAHFATANRAIYDQRPLREDKVSILELCWKTDCEAQTSRDKTSSLFSCLSNLSTQSDLVLRGAKTNEQEFRTQDGQNLLLLCRQISDLQAHLVANAQPNASAGKATQSEPQVAALCELPDRDILGSHKFSAVAKSLSAAPTGRFKRLITEITTLQTGLPPGIFIRYAESRPDVMKFLIVGPIGTPYENGLFEFDVFCDGEFPNKPPLVQFKTTGGGRVGFNPNLYPDGKVCLSLLGTWQGEPWVPNQSTLLQVVISIQAMILCEEPWYNEPGREMSYRRGAGSPSAAYNQAIRQHTVRVAILDWLTNPLPLPLWQGVVDQHFKTNANKILETAVEWAKAKKESGFRGVHGAFSGDEDFDEEVFAQLSTFGRAGNPQQGDIKSMLPELQTALQKYGATFVVPHIPDPEPEKPEKTSKRSKSLLSQSTTYTSPFPPPSPQDHHQHTYISQEQPTSSSGWFGGFGLFSGQGNVLGEAPAPASATSTEPGGRGGPVRYETRSSTRGRGGPSNPGGYSFVGRGGNAGYFGEPVYTVGGQPPSSTFTAGSQAPSSMFGAPPSQGTGGRGRGEHATPWAHNSGWPYGPSRGGGRGRGRGRGDTPSDRGRGGRGDRGGRGY